MPAITTKMAFEAEFKALITEEIERCRNQLEAHYQDPTSTTLLRGRILALRGIEALIEEANKNLDKRNA